MKVTGILLILVLGTNSSVAQQQLAHPEQFYSNGKTVDGWTRSDAEGLRSTFWFVNYPRDSLSYRQQIVIVYDRDPDNAYYYDMDTKLFIGRADLRDGEYSMLEPQDRRGRIEDIDESKFPPGGAMPEIGDMFAGVGRGPGFDTEMMMPPPTMKYPRLDNSSWDTRYVAANGTRIRATVTFNGNDGTYQLENSDQAGRFSNVQYQRRQDEFRITGTWSFNGSSGWFSFDVPMNNMNAVWGEWGFRRGRTDGTWDGVRDSR